MENMTTWLLQNPVLGVQWLSADGAFKSHLGTGDVLVLSCLLTLYTAVMSFEILFPFGLSSLILGFGF